MSNAMIVFEQIDSWFFRESRPHGSVGANALNSVFPPPTRTLMGAIRSQIGQHYFAQHPSHSWDDLDCLEDLKSVIGDADCLGDVQPRGVFLQHCTGKNATYYLPAPANLCRKHIKDNDFDYLAFSLSQELYQTDLGLTHLVELPKKTTKLDDTRGFKPLENVWVSATIWQQILEGNLNSLSTQSEYICDTADFTSSEYRLGIGVQTDTRNVREGLLYQTTHVRLKPDVRLVMPIRYTPERLQTIASNLFDKPLLVRLGGEARMASITLQKQSTNYLPQAPQQPTTQAINGKKRFMLYLVSKLRMQTDSWLPEGFCQSKQGFDGSINGIDFKILSACMGKAYREGGWNQLEHKPRAIENYLPPGSAFFVEVDAAIPDNQIIQQLHGQVVNDNAWGEGLMLVGKMISA